MEKYRLYIRQYDITTNDYKVREEIVETNDIYHTIGKMYCSSITEIKRIDYQRIDEKRELKRKYENEIKKVVNYIKDHKDYNFTLGQEILCENQIIKLLELLEEIE